MMSHWMWALGIPPEVQTTLRLEGEVWRNADWMTTLVFVALFCLAGWCYTAWDQATKVNRRVATALAWEAARPAREAKQRAGWARERAREVTRADVRARWAAAHVDVDQECARA